MNFFADLIRAVLPGASAWRLGASRSVEVSASTPVAKLYVAATGGTLYMGMGANSIYVPYNYAGIGGGVGVGLSPPVNASVATTDFPSTGGEWGRLYIPPSMIARVDLARDTIAGPAVLINPGIQWCVSGAGFSVILFGPHVSALDFSGPLSLLTDVKAVAFQAGLSATLGVGASCTVHNLAILPGGRMLKM